MLSWEAARRFAKDGITVTCCHPGVTGSTLNESLTGVKGGVSWHSAIQTAALPLYLATNSAVSGVTGKWFSGGNIPKKCTFDDVNSCAKLW
jgi:hypothetical protein